MKMEMMGTWRRLRSYWCNNVDVMDEDDAEEGGKDGVGDEELEDGMEIEEERVGVGGLADDVMGAGRSRVVGSDNMEDHGLFLGSNVLSNQLKSRATRTPSRRITIGRTGISIHPTKSH
jgi:hypothetical protein